MLKRLKISQKIYVLGFIQLILMLIMGIIALSQMAKIGVELVDIAEEHIPLGAKVTHITELQLEQAILIERTLFYKSLNSQNSNVDSVKLINLNKKVSELTHTIEKDIISIKTFVSKAIEIVHTEEVKNEYRHVLVVLNNVQERYKILINKIEGFNLLNNADELIELSSKFEKIQSSLQQELIDLSTEIQKFTLSASLKAEHDEQTGIIWISVAFIISLAVGLVLPFVISQSIVKPINLLSSRLAEIANGDGDLTVRLDEKSKDETGDVARAFNQFISVLRTLISNTNNQADELGKSAEVALEAMRSTASNVDNQRTETEMVATAVNEMSTATQEVARNAAHAADVTENVKDKVSEGKKDAIETQTIIKQLSEEVTEASQVIASLVEETNNIGNVLESIQGIAAQTNLLALNAAIEAARAGETGRGFAVVADEVRTLAQRTQTSTVDIQDLLVRLKTEANNAVTSMYKGTESADLCIEKSAKTSQTFEDAANFVAQISDLNAQIATAAEEQSVVAEEINKNIVKISGLADITAQGAKSTSEANSKIAENVNDLHNNLSVFKV
ncbi:methyl-accepting chemotaxis protein [Paraglaciecola arctica]|uniref:Hemolysin secretion protein n=1 Tax=Paraglaciecola arctica BSs20135 TaxID=493475 RepID=K6YHR2_9ALTE|nr:methyl-accepting chemotaxis protein [Paraglaciecola arctica]GAC17712.1 hemolysin secretion protein [Paraglaciecola arctica BSs20135]